MRIVKFLDCDSGGPALLEHNVMKAIIALQGVVVASFPYKTISIQIFFKMKLDLWIKLSPS